MYTVYMLRCADNTLYTGLSKNIEQRLRMHNGQLSGGARYTRTRRPVTLVYSEQCSSWKEAFARELAIKKMAKIKKEKLAQQWQEKNR